MSSGEWKHELLSRSVLPLVSGWMLLCAGWSGPRINSLDLILPGLNHITSPSRHLFQLHWWSSKHTAESYEVLPWAALKDLWIHHPWQKTNLADDDASARTAGSVSGSRWHLCGQTAVLSHALLHRASVGQPGQPARLPACHKQGVLHVSRVVTLLMVISINSWPCSRHVCLDVHVCVYSEFRFTCFSHTFIRPVLVKTVSFFLACRALVIIIIHILHVLQCGFLGAASDIHPRPPIPHKIRIPTHLAVAWLEHPRAEVLVWFRCTVFV